MLRSLVLVVLLDSFVLAWAQVATGPADMQAALDAAQADARRAGDESLGCEALETELVATVNQPAVQSFVAKAGAHAQERNAAMKAASSAPAALALFGSIVPGGDWAAIGAAAAMAPAQRAQTELNLQQRMQQAQEMMGILPQIMRGQRVIELAQGRGCAWARSATR